MRNMIKRVSRSNVSISFLCTLLLIFFTASTSYSSIFSYKHTAEEKPASTEENIAKTNNDSDGEIPSSSSVSTANPDEQTNLYLEIPGVGAFFGNMLDSLINLSKSSENRFQLLTHHFPLVFPDLYKVFITL